MSKLVDAIKSVDKTPEKMQEINEALNLLVSLCEAKVSGFRSEIEMDLAAGRTQTNLRIPVTGIAKSHEEYRCLATDKISEKNLQDIADSIGGMFTDPSATNIINGISKMIGTALGVLLGCAEGTEQYTKLYTIAVDGVSIVRFDFVLWNRKLTAKSITEKIQNAMACVAYKSFVDISKMTRTEFITIYQELVWQTIDPKLKPKEKAAQIKEILEAAVEIYDLLASHSTHRLYNTAPESIQGFREDLKYINVDIDDALLPVRELDQFEGGSIYSQPIKPRLK